MKKLFFSLLAAFVSASGVFAATEQSWYNDITSCTAGMQVYIYTPNGKGFVQENAAKCFKATSTAAPAMWTISKQDDGTIKSTNGYYLRAYQTNSNTTSKSTADGSEKVCVTSMKSGAYWNIHGHYKFGAVTYYAALYYKDGYEAKCNMLGNKETHEDSEYQFYFISADQYTRHWVIYEFDAYKETFSPSNYTNKIPAAMLTALNNAYNKTLDIKSNTTTECQTALSNLKQIKTDADNAISVYATVWGKINNLDAITDRGEDPTVVNNAISSAKTNIELATTTAAIQAIGDGLKQIDPITFDSTQYNALTSVAGCASSANKQALTFTSSNQAVVNNDMMALYKGKTTITATLAESDDYYPFVRSAQITVLAINNSYNYSAATCDNEPYSDENFKNLTEAKQYQTTLENLTGGDSLITLTLSILPTYFFTETKTMWVGKDSTWHGKELKGYAVGNHVIYDSLKTINDCDSIYKLALTVNALPTTHGADSAFVCPGDSALYEGKYYTAGEYNVTLKNWLGGDSIVALSVKNLPTYFFEETKTMWVGKDSTWHGKELKGYAVGKHVIYDSLKTINDCDSIYKLALTVNALPTTHGADSAFVCPGDSALYEGKYYTAGEYNVTLKNWLGSDSIVALSVKNLPTYFFEETKTMYVGKDSTWRGKELKNYAVGEHVIYDSLKTINDCDSIYKLALTVNALPTTHGADSAFVCPGDSALYEGKYYTAGEYNVTLKNWLGGDSIVALSVKDLPTYLFTDYKTMWVGKDSLWRGKELKGYMVGNHIVYDSLKTVADCDSVYRLFLTVNALPTTYGKDSAFVCPGDSVMYNSVYYQVGVHDSILISEKNWLGGDSVVTFTVNALPTYLQRDTLSYLLTEELLWRGQPIDVEHKEGVYDLVDSLKTVAGCDSIFTLHLTLSRAEQAIYFELLQDTIFVGDTIHLSAIATSGLSVIYTLTPDSLVTEVEYVLMAVLPGTLEITASQEGDDTYLAAESVSRTLVIVEPTGMREVFGEASLSETKKFIQNGRVYILRGNDLFDLLGNKVQ